jgi:signal transduction histidine kinase
MGHGVMVACRGRFVRAGTFDGSLTTLDSNSGTFALPGTTNLPAVETAPLPKELSEAGIVLYQCHAGPSLTLWLFVGPKRSGRRYVEVDVRLIQDLAVLAGEVMERLFWIQAATEEALERTRLAELDRMKNEFLSRVAHDLRTPLSSITWSAENLIDGVDGGDASTRARYLRSIKVSASHLNHLVHNLLELSRLEKGASHLELETLSLQDVVHRGVLALLPLAEEKGVTFDVQCDAEPVHVQADPGKLLEVVLNLFDNALKYSPQGSRIEIRVERAAGDRACFIVRDLGPGLGSLAPADLFQRYRQGAPSPHASQEGFGLGLHVVKTFLDLMGGTVTARTHPEGGAEFTASLPLAPLPVSN